MKRAHATRPAFAGPSARASAPALIGITVVAALLRLLRLEHAPPGLNQDEAVNAWSAYCLLRTGTDMTGAAWPVFYSHAIGDNRTTLFFYWLIPFQAALGLSTWSARFAMAMSGIACVPLIYRVGSRLFGRTTGLVAAALLAINPWHVAMSRLAIEGGLLMFFGLAILVLGLEADVLSVGQSPRAPRPGLASIAGLVAGISCYGYWAQRLFVPAFLILALTLAFPAWKSSWRARGGPLAIALFVLVMAVTLGPLAFRHLVDPAIMVRASMTRLWDPGTPPLEIVGRVLGRYAAHFAPDFLFVSGDRNAMAGPSGWGAFEWATLPAMLAGMWIVLRGVRSTANALLLALTLAYPAGDLVSLYEGVHPFRSAPGIATLALLAALGAVDAARWIARRKPALAVVASGALGLAALVQDARYYQDYFFVWPRETQPYHYFHTDFMKACEWLRPRLAPTDDVLWTENGINMPFALTLVGLRYDPRAWFTDEKDLRRASGGWDVYMRYGRMYFLYGQENRAEVERLQANGRDDHAWFVLRPGELGLKNPVFVVHRPDGVETLWICEGNL